MRVHVLGTSAAEGIPAFYCACRVCREAARRRGRDMRTRSSVLVDGTLKFDNGPDTYAQKLMHDLDLARVTALVFTHAHEDHFTPTELIWRADDFIQVGELPMLHVFGNRSICDRIEDLCRRYEVDNGDLCGRLRLDLAEIKPYEQFTTGAHAVHPVRAAHDPKQVSLNFVVESQGRALLVGFDTGWYGDETWEYLSDHRLDCLLMDCTTGKHREGEHHMGLPDNLRVRDEMAKRGTIHAETRYVLTHISHGGDLLHDELAEAAEKEGMIAAYDGMVIDV